MLRHAVLIISLLLLHPLSYSQQSVIRTAGGKNIQVKDLDATIERLREAAGVTGISVGIINDNEPVYIKSYGFRNKPQRTRNTDSTSLYAASFSKSLFAFIVMQLVDQGKIDLDKPLHQYLPKPLPEYTDYKDLAGDDRWKQLTIRHCLSHTTGFPNWRFLNPNGSGKLEIFFTPGTRYAYSGEGIVLAQLVVETITGTRLADLARRQVFEPFAMQHTSYTWQPSFDNNYAVGHSVDEDTFSIRKRTSANAAGSMQTTITDFTHFMAAILQGKGMSTTTRTAMLSPQIAIFSKRQFPSLNTDTTSANRAIELSYGLGWGLFRTPFGQAFFKEGHSDDGWVNYCIAIPDKKISLVIMSNSMNGESIFRELTQYVLDVTIPWEWEGYLPYKPTVKLPGSLLKRYTGAYTGQAKARIFLENGQLKIEAPEEGLAKSTLYATGDKQFFLKLIPLSIEFITKADGSVEKILVNDDGVHFELTPAAPEKTTEVFPPKELLETYTGSYKMDNTTMKVVLKNGRLLLDIRGQEKMELQFLSDTKFRVKSILDIKGEFIKEHDKVVSMVIEQNGTFVWKRL